MPEAVLPTPAQLAASHLAVRHVFVYGTLRRGGAQYISRLLTAPQFVGLVTDKGTMYVFGAYPGGVLGLGEACGCLPGEVYAIAPELEGVLDEIEEVYPQQRDEYFRRHVAVTVAGVDVDCIVYEINPAYVAGRATIAGGDWLRRRVVP